MVFGKKTIWSIAGIVILVILVIIVFMFINRQSKIEKEIILFKCGGVFEENFCVQLYPDQSKYTGTSVDLRLTVNEDKRVMDCPIDGGTGSEFASCVETLKQDGCNILETDLENNRFYALFSCQIQD